MSANFYSLQTSCFPRNRLWGTDIYIFCNNSSMASSFWLKHQAEIICFLSSFPAAWRSVKFKLLYSGKLDGCLEDGGACDVVVQRTIKLNNNNAVFYTESFLLNNGTPVFNPHLGVAFFIPFWGSLILIPKVFPRWPEKDGAQRSHAYYNDF